MFARLKIPGSAMTVVARLIEFATFDVADSFTFEEELIILPEEEPYSLNFGLCNIEATTFLANIGFAKYVILGNLTLCILAFLFQKVHWVRKTFFEALYWNGLIRLLMEMYLDLVLLAAFDLTVATESVMAGAVNLTRSSGLTLLHSSCSPSL